MHNNPRWLSGLGAALGLAAGACESSPDGDVACEGWRPGDVVLTELLPDPEGTDTGREWLEVYNPRASAVDLRGLLLYAARADGTQEHAYLIETPLLVAARDFAVLGDARTGALVPPLDHTYGDALGALSNAGGVVGLRCGDVVVDEVRYSKTRAGHARILSGGRVPDAFDNDAPERWCEAPVTADAGLRASPGEANPPCPPGALADGGTPDTCLSALTGLSRRVSPPGPGDLRITEVMADPRTVPDAQGEWVEVSARRDVDLNGVTLSNEGGGRAVLEAPRCLELRAGAYALLAHSEDPRLNGGLPPVLGLFSFGVSNTAGPHLLRLSWADETIDEVAWTQAPLPGVSQQFAPACAAPESARYGPGDGERGTPGGENRPCGP